MNTKSFKGTPNLAGRFGGLVGGAFSIFGCYLSGHFTVVSHQLTSEVGLWYEITFARLDKTGHCFSCKAFWTVVSCTSFSWFFLAVILTKKLGYPQVIPSGR